LGRPITPGRSVATDERIFPPGALAFLETDRPEGGPDGGVRWGTLARVRPHPGHGRRTPRPRSCRLLLGSRGDGGVRGGSHATGRPSVLPRAPADGGRHDRVHPRAAGGGGRRVVNLERGVSEASEVGGRRCAAAR